MPNELQQKALKVLASPDVTIGADSDRIVATGVMNPREVASALMAVVGNPENFKTTIDAGRGRVIIDSTYSKAFGGSAAFEASPDNAEIAAAKAMLGENGIKVATLSGLQMPMSVPAAYSDKPDSMREAAFQILRKPENTVTISPDGERIIATGPAGKELALALSSAVGDSVHTSMSAINGGVQIFDEDGVGAADINRAAERMSANGITVNSRPIHTHELVRDANISLALQGKTPVTQSPALAAGAQVPTGENHVAALGAKPHMQTQR